MKPVARRMSSGAVELVAQGIDGIRQEARQVRRLWQPAGHRSVDDEWGRSESIDPDNVGDIAHEGAGHRG